MLSYNDGFHKRFIGENTVVKTTRKYNLLICLHYSEVYYVREF